MKVTKVYKTEGGVRVPLARSSRIGPWGILMAAVLCVIVAMGPSLRGFVLDGHKWPGGNVILYTTPFIDQARTLEDGSGSFGAVVDVAVAEWNRYLSAINLVVIHGGNPAQVSGDGINAIWFSSTAFGEAWDPDTLAETSTFTSDTGSAIEIADESDIAFNNVHYSWDSYRGAPKPTEDMKRTLLHELGHLLGLGHEDNPNADTIMNTAGSEVAAIGADDVQGVTALYGTGPRWYYTGDQLFLQNAKTNLNLANYLFFFHFAHGQLEDWRNIGNEGFALYYHYYWLGVAAYWQSLAQGGSEGVAQWHQHFNWGLAHFYLQLVSNNDPAAANSQYAAYIAEANRLLALNP